MSHDESLEKTYHERRAERIGVDVPMSHDQQPIPTYQSLQSELQQLKNAIELLERGKYGRADLQAQLVNKNDEIKALQSERDELLASKEKVLATAASFEHWGKERSELQSERDKLQQDLNNCCSCQHDGKGNLTSRCEFHRLLEEERDKLLGYLERAGWGPCNAAACNCNGWHKVRQSKDERELEEERDKLKTAIRTHRDQRGDDRCWMDDQKLYEALGESAGDNSLPPKEKFLANCSRFYDNRCRNAEWKSYQEIEEERDQLKEQILKLQELLKNKTIGDRLLRDWLKIEAELVQLRVTFDQNFQQYTTALAKKDEEIARLKMLLSTLPTAVEAAEKDIITAQGETIYKLRACLQSIIDGCVNPEKAHRRVMVDLAPIRKVLKDTDPETKTPPK